MKRTLYLKFLLAYLLFGIFGFIVVATFVYDMTYERLRRDKADNMYRVATQIANTYAADLYTNMASLETVHQQLVSLSMYMDESVIWIVNPSGRLVLDSSRAFEDVDGNVTTYHRNIDINNCKRANRGLC